VSKWGNKDIEALKKIVSEDDFYGIGNAEHEIHSSYAKLMEHWSDDFREADQIEPVLEMKYVSIRGDIAWCVFFMKTDVLVEKNKYSVNFRITGIVERTSEGLKMVQMHGSVPHTGIEEGRSFPSPAGMTEVLEKWIMDFDLNPDVFQQSRVKQLRTYLEKAREITKTLE
jgi:hypothetical protein